VDFDKKRVFVEESAIQRDDNLALTNVSSAGKGDGVAKKGKVFGLAYDKLVVAVGCYSQTFGTKGVKENALFLKDVGDARKIRKRILDCWPSQLTGSTNSADGSQVSKQQPFHPHQML
jgi:NADH dehydrogenase FAD-containing subunit